MLTIFAIIVAVAIYLFFNPNMVFEQVFKFGQDYEKSSAEDVRIYVTPQVPYQTEGVLEQLKSTREVVQQLLNKNFETHNSLAIFVTELGYRGHERLTGLTGAYFYAMGVILINGEEPQFASSTTVHEYTHFLFGEYLKEQQLTFDEIPDWFTEGLAEYVAFQVEHALPQKYSLYYNHFPFTEMQTLTNTNVDAVYMQGFYAFHDLVTQFGTEVMAQLLTKYKDTSDFKIAFTQVTGMNYSTYHDQFFINRNELAKLNNLKSSPQDVLTYGEQLLENRASINPYAPFVLPDLVGAALALGNVNLAKEYFNQLERLLFNPNDYLYFAEAFNEAAETKLALQLVEKGREFALKYNYDLEDFEREVKKVLR